ncbi:MAG: hypothetical protein RMY29_024015 [Nostoc sp. CreGUA01]|nr:hypothetical protein [Nostoc sp. CreGUA01]
MGNGAWGDEGDEEDEGVWGVWGERFLPHPPTPDTPPTLAVCPMPTPHSPLPIHRTYFAPFCDSCGSMERS